MLRGPAHAMIPGSFGNRPSVPGHTVLRGIGAGSSGEVWLARSETGAWRAVKVVRRDRFEDERSFLREFEAVRRFERLSREHPGFIDILQTGWTDDGAGYFYVMELGDGDRPGWTAENYAPRTLARVLRDEGRLTTDACVELGLRLCEGLQALHAEGLIHRDIKPSNVVYADGVPKLADIGTVIGTHEAQSYVGTEGFIAPEGPNSAQADVYALGKLLYVAATGKDRRDFPDPGAEMESGPEAPRLRELNLVLLKACAAHPSRRYPSSRHLHADLGRLRSGRSIRWHRRREVLARGTAGVLALVAVWALSLPMARLRRPHPPSSAPPHFDRIQASLAKGQERLDAGDESGAMVCFAEALSETPRDTAEHRAQRVRLRLLSDRIPELLHAFRAGRSVASIAVSPDGKQAVVADEEGSLTSWEDGRTRRLSPPGKTDAEPVSIRYGGGRDLIVAPDALGYWSPASMQRRVGRILDARSGMPLGPDFATDGPMAFDSEGRVVVLATQEGNIEVRDARTGRSLLHAGQHSSGVVRIVISPSSRLVATADKNGLVHVWTLADGMPAGPPVSTGRPVVAMDFTPDEQRLVLVSEDRLNRSSLRVHGIDGKTADAAVFTLPGRVGSLDVRPHAGRRMVVWHRPGPGEASSGLSIRDGSTPGSVLAELWPGGQCRCFAVSHDGRWIAAGGDGVGACVWDMATGQPVTAMLGHAGGVGAVAFSPDGSRLFTGGADGLVKVWDLSSLGSRWTTIPVRGRLAHAWTPERPYPVVAAGERHLILKTVSDGRPVARCVNLAAGHEESLPPCPEDLPAAFLAASPDGDAWAMFDDAATPPAPGWDIGVWRRIDGHWALRRLPHPAPVVAAVFASQPSRLLTLDATQQLYAWHDAGPPNSAGARRHGSSSNPVFSRDGSRLVAIEDGKVLRVVNTADPRSPPLRIPMPDFIECFAISSDGTLVATAVRGVGLMVSSCIEGSRVTMGGAIQRRVIPFPALLSWAPKGRRLIVQPNGAEAQVIDWDRHDVVVLRGTGGGPIQCSVSFGEDDRWIVVRTSHDAVWVADAATGLPVSPAYRYASRVRHAMITSQGRLVILADPNEVHVLDMEADATPVHILRDQARWTSGRQWDGSASLAWLNLDDFKRPLPQPQERPGRSSALQGARVPSHPPNSPRRSTPPFGQPPSLSPRHASLPARALDLSRFYTHSLESLGDGDLAALPTGRHRLAEVEFDLRGMVRLESESHLLHWRRRGTTPPDAYPLSAVRGIPLPATCHRIQFLMGVDAPQEDHGAILATWRIHFCDGTSSERPVLYGHDLLDWHSDFRRDGSGPAPRVAWSGPMPSPRLGDISTLYVVTWENPSPGQPLRELDFLLGSAISRPFCVAISVE